MNWQMEAQRLAGELEAAEAKMREMEERILVLQEERDDAQGYADAASDDVKAAERNRDTALEMRRAAREALEEIEDKAEELLRRARETQKEIA